MSPDTLKLSLRCRAQGQRRGGQLLSVAKGGYALLRAGLGRALCQVFVLHQRRYATRRLRAELHAKGYAVGRWRIRRTLVQHGWRAQQPRSFA